MKGFNRQNQLLSLCGLNCGLCPMNLDKHCPGCGGAMGTSPVRLQNAVWSTESLNTVVTVRTIPVKLLTRLICMILL